LELELTRRGAENQTLLHARIEALQKQMELEMSLANADAVKERERIRPGSLQR
jgi:hypothetical protein